MEIFLSPPLSHASSSAISAALSTTTPYPPSRTHPPLSHALLRRRSRRQPPPPKRRLASNPSTPQMPAPPPPTHHRLPDSTSALVGPRLNLHNRVQSLIRANDLDSAAALARHSVFSNTRPTVFTCNAIIASMYRAKRFHDAIVLFQYFFNQCNIVPNVVSYNNLIVSHCESGEVDRALEVYRYILDNAPFSPSSVTYRHITKGLIDAGRIGEASDFLREMLVKGHGADSLVFNNLISGYLSLGNLEKALELFDELKERCAVYDGVVSATFMEYWFKEGKVKEAMQEYKGYKDRKYRMVPATSNVLLEVLLKYGRKTEAWALFEEMLDNHTPPTFQAVNSDTFSLMVNEMFKEGKIEESMEVFKKCGTAAKSKPFSMDVAGFNNMIVRFSEIDRMEEAEKYFAELQSKSLSPDVTSYKNLIEGYIRLDRCDEALDRYTKMVEAGLRVIPEYANKWFSYLVEKGKIAECVPILTKMAEREPKPDVTTYDIVLRALCNQGDFDTALNIVTQMMNYSVGFTAALKEFMLAAFEKEGRREEVDKIVNARYPFFAPQRPPVPPRVPFQQVSQLGSNTPY
ncbi:hypothetical protein Leryth_018086 [Lithospermum erythrorhizon]|nr:hypothetical protein Leryth_018086 [Lithospermum erythrorhizon]